MELENVLTSNVVDLTSIKSFFASDKDMLIQLIGVYLSDTTPRIETLEQSLIQVNYDDVRSICHFLKSSFGLMGIGCLDEIAALEKQAQHHEFAVPPLPLPPQSTQPIATFRDNTFCDHRAKCWLHPSSQTLPPNFYICR